MLEEIEIGEQIALEVGKSLSLQDFVKAIEHRLNWDAFDYETGDTELIEAILVILHSYVYAGGTIDYSLVEQAKEQERKSLEEDAKAMAVGESQETHECGPAIGQEALRRMYEQYHIE